MFHSRYTNESTRCYVDVPIDALPTLGEYFQIYVFKWSMWSPNLSKAIKYALLSIEEKRSTYDAELELYNFVRIYKNNIHSSLWILLCVRHYCKLSNNHFLFLSNNMTACLNFCFCCKYLLMYNLNNVVGSNIILQGV